MVFNNILTQDQVLRR